MVLHKHLPKQLDAILITGRLCLQLLAQQEHQEIPIWIAHGLQPQSWVDHNLVTHTSCNSLTRTNPGSTESSEPGKVQSATRVDQKQQMQVTRVSEGRPSMARWVQYQNVST